MPTADKSPTRTFGTAVVKLVRSVDNEEKVAPIGAVAPAGRVLAPGQASRYELGLHDGAAYQRDGQGQVDDADHDEIFSISRQGAEEHDKVPGKGGDSLDKIVSVGVAVSD